MKPHGISLYHYEGCPFCSRVRDALPGLGLELALRDIQQNADHLEELVNATGRQMVPCLRIEEESGSVRWMHESADIVDYLKDRFVS